ncbi:MAG: response regulator [Candidatus Marinimicrobia bacterium]|jgi:signal transduction histidine kinase/CheY-like chemotaxis protein/ligand-binding sensor domain-containing protein|nr:response regulator [Candidatus Neomarinimicrobiota bacterium]MBT3937067.1 response regulator [Candidatus Neomarinimicrobiota bacterium]MBT3962037.1 response regulator [Candidatus Neomarinimicrobiota bacterium]MBT4382405.1 response regulator [Candidatus Neomarinimicrobiota bacterium]MBT4636522.1 response regulator [Candidatus Neomarinimicrobiota bacterium]
MNINHFHIVLGGNRTFIRIALFFSLVCSLLVGQIIPVSNINNVTINKWVVVKDENFNKDKLNLLIKDPAKFITASEQTVTVDLGTVKDSPIQVYQLFKNFTHTSSIAAITRVDLPSEQDVAIGFGNFDLDASIYINGNLVMSENNRDDSNFKVQFKKGENDIIITGNVIGGNRMPSFFARFYGEQRGEIEGTILDAKNKPVPFATIDFKSEYINMTSQSDKNGKYNLWVYPNYGNYTIEASKNNYYGHSEDVYVKEFGRYNIDIKLINTSSISGTVFTMDKKTPHPGVVVQLENIVDQKIIQTNITDQTGKYTFTPPIGKYKIRLFANNTYIYKKNNKNENDIINLTSKGHKYERDFFIQNQNRGSWNSIGMFDGMLSMAVHITLLSSEDILYTGTYNGLSVYDGLSVKTYNYDHDLPNSPIFDVFEDNEGFIWLAFASKGIVKWKSGRVIQHYTIDDGLVSNHVNTIDQDKDGNLLIGTQEGLSIFDGEKFTNYNFTHGIGNGFITDIEVVGKNIWIGTGALGKAGTFRTYGGGLTLYNGKTFKSFDLTPFTGIDLNIAVINCIKEYDGTIWIGTLGGLLKYDGSKFHMYTKSDGLPSNNINDILIDNNGIWICTNSGLANFNNGGFKVITTLDVKSDGLTGLYGTTAISKSRDGIYFIGGQGVSLYDPNSLKTISAYDGMPVPNNWTNGISDIELGKDGYLWVTSGWNGIYKLSGEVIIENYNINNSKIPANRTIAISFANDGSMWGAHGNAGVSRFINGEFENMTDKLNIPANTIITDIAFDEQGTLWLATNRGLAKYKNDTLTIFDEKDGLIMPKRNCDINIGLNGEIIYSTYGSGISIYDGETFKNYDESNGLVDNRIWDLTVDSKNNIWMATDGSGVQMFDGATFVHHSVNDGVTAGETFSIYADDFDNIWVGTFGGGVCFYDGNVWSSVDTRDGLLQDLIGSIEGIDGNKFWFGSENGITVYEPKRQTPYAYIEQIKTPNGNYNTLEINLLRVDDLLEKSRISFTFNSNSYNTRKEKQKYIIHIKGNGQKETHLIKTNEFEYFPNKSGEYTIEFQSIDRDLNYSPLNRVQLGVIGPWYKNPATAIPFWGFIIIILLFSGFTSNKYLKQKQYSMALKDASQKKDRKTRKHLEEKNTELVESQKAAEAANEAKSTFLANMSHELRTPLNAIIGYSEMLMEDAEDENEEFIPDLDKINNSGKHLLGLINDILDLSKVESGKMELFLEEFNLSKIMDEIESTILPMVEKNNNSLKINIKSDTKTIVADITKIRQIILNLLSNSSKFTKDGTISINVVESNSQDDSIDFIIADTGIGMSQDQVEKVFMPFTQADEKTTRKFGGTGLGLTITKMFAEMMGGDIALSSVEGEGTTFIVTIPRCVVDPKKESSEILPVDLSESDFTILVIDDDDNAQGLMKKFLNKQGYSIIQALSGKDGIKLANEQHPDLITLDVMMPEMDGWEVLAELQANDLTKNIPVIMLSMADEPDIGFSLGATDYLTKPINWSRLSDVLGKYHIDATTDAILIVEDDKITRDMLRKSLESNEYKVRTAINGKKGLEAIEVSKPSLIILDLMMPEMDGFEFAEKLRENKEWLDIPVVVVTAKDLTKDDHKRLKGNVEAIMQKGSYSKNDLLSEVGEKINKLKTGS